MTRLGSLNLNLSLSSSISFTRPLRHEHKILLSNKMLKTLRYARNFQYFQKNINLSSKFTTGLPSAKIGDFGTGFVPKSGGALVENLWRNCRETVEKLVD